MDERCKRMQDAENAHSNYFNALNNIYVLHVLVSMSSTFKSYIIDRYACICGASQSVFHNKLSRVFSNFVLDTTNLWDKWEIGIMLYDVLLKPQYTCRYTDFILFVSLVHIKGILWDCQRKPALYRDFYHIDADFF